MKKRTYRFKEVKRINWDELKENLSGEKIAVAIDVAKQKQYAVLTNSDGSVSTLFHWRHPEQTAQMFEAVTSLSCPVTLIVESTSTYH